ncbi:LCP family protein [Patescibacteria group bacterium]|nr:LCP family protein [Patescibacteria group bacterium]
MHKKLLISAFLLGITCTIAYISIKKWVLYPKEGSTLLTPILTDENGSLNPFGKMARNAFGKFSEQRELFGDVINILLIGTDTSITRRTSGQLGFNTDTLILVSANINTNRILLTSVPRDLWINGNKINALHTALGYEILQDAFEKITGQKIDGFIKTDFDGFIWLVDAFGGVPVEVERTFSDYSFPNFEDTDIMTVSFTQGYELMPGERALIFARSRKGTNGEGSDLMRAKRQHLLLEGIVDGVSQESSQFSPMDISEFYDTVVQHMETSLNIDDVYYLWDFYKDRDKYEIESFVVGEDYLYHPGMYPDSPYHAWVFVPREDSFEKLHLDIEAKLNGTFVSEEKLTESEGISTEPQNGIGVGSEMLN